MKTTHTPGPWKVEADPEWKGKHPFHDARFITSGPHSINDDDNQPFLADPSCQIIARLTDCSNQKANARLIAAAPELLEAAKLMLEFYNDLSKSNPGFMGKLCLQDYGRWNEALIKLPAAVTKALGGAK